MRVLSYLTARELTLSRRQTAISERPGGCQTRHFTKHHGKRFDSMGARAHPEDFGGMMAIDWDRGTFTVDRLVLSRAFSRNSQGSQMNVVSSQEII
jgi:hypothetical protein